MDLWWQDTSVQTLCTKLSPYVKEKEKLYDALQHVQQDPQLDIVWKLLKRLANNQKDLHGGALLIEHDDEEQQQQQASENTVQYEEENSFDLDDDEDTHLQDDEDSPVHTPLSLLCRKPILTFSKDDTALLQEPSITTRIVHRRAASLCEREKPFFLQDEDEKIFFQDHYPVPTDDHAEDNDEIGSVIDNQHYHDDDSDEIASLDSSCSSTVECDEITIIRHEKLGQTSGNKQQQR